MDIRTKLALALVSTSLLAMLVLGTFTYLTTFELLQEASTRRLEALAESKQLDLEKVIQSWRDRVELIRSRTRLRALLASHGSQPDLEKVSEIRRILEDAIDSVSGVDRVALFDASGSLVVTVGSSPVSPDGVTDSLAKPGTVHLGATHVWDDGRVAVQLRAALRLEGRTIGALETIISAKDLLSVTQNYTGLGETGEASVFMSEADGGAVVLSPLRHDAALRRVDAPPRSCPANALAGRESVFRDGMLDYRGAVVWCATRTLPEIGWGLVVKIDEAEELERAEWLRSQIIDLGLALGAIAILGGTLLGMHLGKPLRTLTVVVERIRGGDLDLRADTSAADEVGLLAEALNELLDEQQER